MPLFHRRLAAASIGVPGRVCTAWVPCPSWCVVDHLAERQVAIEDITHYGPPRFLQVPSMLDGLDAVHEWAVSIMLDPAAEDERMRVAHLVVNDGGPADAYLTGAQGLAYADELRRFADDVQKLSAECIEPLGTALC